MNLSEKKPLKRTLKMARRVVWTIRPKKPEMGREFPVGAMWLENGLLLVWNGYSQIVLPPRRVRKIAKLMLKAMEYRYGK